MTTKTRHKMLAAMLLLAPGRVGAVDLSNVPQLHETPAQRDARMQWFRDAKFGMFIHWGPCAVGSKEIGWDRKANRPWDINGIQTPRTEDACTTTTTSSSIRQITTPARGSASRRSRA